MTTNPATLLDPDLDRDLHLDDALQLSLFESNVPERFRLDDATRRRGMRHIARLKAQLEARYPSTPSPVPRVEPSRDTKAREAAA